MSSHQQCGDARPPFFISFFHCPPFPNRYMGRNVISTHYKYFYRGAFVQSIDERLLRYSGNFCTQESGYQKEGSIQRKGLGTKKRKKQKTPMFRGLLGKAAKPALPPPVTDDYVYPVHAQDGIKGNRYVLYFAMRFGGVLDAEKLHSALSRLLALEGWRKLGGRLRLKVCICMFGGNCCTVESQKERDG